ncbi:uncharacterized protein LOC111078992 [Drosophila obscura]|nr:uncharacterized protein LOC111078992 [Drosophila obscura]
MISYFGLQVLFGPLLYSIKMTSTLLSCIGNFLQCLWLPPLRHA